MGRGAYISIHNGRPEAIVTSIANEKCMLDNGDHNSNLSLFNATIGPNTTFPSAAGQYIEVDDGFPCFAEVSTFGLVIEDDHHMPIGEADFEESNEKYSLGGNSSPALIGVTVDNSGSYAHISVTVTGADAMITANRWILSHQGRTADIWYNQDYTVYGLDPAAGTQAPSDGNVVTLLDLKNGNVALQCAGGYYAFASMRDDYGYQVQFQAPHSATWCTQVGGNEVFQAIPTGDGYFALYSPTFKRYVAINPSPNPKAGNCNALTGSATEISAAARFTATGLDRSSVLDFLQVGKTAAGLSFAGVDLTQAKLSGYNLSQCDFTKATTLKDCDLTHSNVRGATFAGQSLEGLLVAGTDGTGADFTGCDFDNLNTWDAPRPVLAQANLTGATVPGALSELNLAGANFTDANLTGCYLVGSNLADTDFTGTNLTGSDFTHSKLTGATTNLTGAKFTGATLTRCNFGQANLSGATLAGLDLTTAALAGANLAGTNLSGAKLAGVNLTGANLAGTNFTGTDLTKVIFPSPLTQSTDPDHPTVFASCTLPYQAIGLNWSCLDLTSATITGLPTDSAGQVNLTGLNAKGARRPGGDFQDAILDGANFANATLDKAVFTGAQLRAKASFAGARLIDAVFTRAVLDQANFAAAALGGVQRAQAANFSFAYLTNCNFAQANLYGVKFPMATLDSGNTLTGAANLQDTDFSGAYLPSTDFTGADLQGAIFDGAFMVGCNLTGANLSTSQQGAVSASLAGACLQGAILQGTNLAGANLAEAAITDQNGSIDQQHYGEDGSLTTPFPARYRGGSFPDPSSFSDDTICPNTLRYDTNHDNGATMAEMMTAPHVPTQWKPPDTERK